eukprot:m51a1_g10052 hypothetical protein (255) ;mRNA; r:50458-51525
MADNAPYLNRLKEVTVLDVDGQAKAFLRAFVMDFQGNFEVVLNQAEEYKKYSEGKNEMDEHRAHIFLEKMGEARTVVDLREKLKQIDVDCNGKMSFVEYALFKHGKTLRQMFTAANPQKLLEELDRAIEQFHAVIRERAEREKRIAELEGTVAAGGKDAARAKAELMRLRMQDPAKSGAEEINALAAKMKAKAALRNPEEALREQEEEAKRAKEEAWRQEQAKVDAEKRRKEEEEARKRDESRQRLKDRAKAFQ